MGKARTAVLLVPVLRRQLRPLWRDGDTDLLDAFVVEYGEQCSSCVTEQRCG